MSKFFAILVALTVVLASSAARADRSTIRDDTDHPSYFFEAEPHLAIAPFRKGGIGAGFQGTFNVADRGFIQRLNDSIGVGFGVNWVTNDHWSFSGAMQWNFWLSENWSVFGEPGIAVHADEKIDIWPHLGAGGRFHFTRNFTLTMRIGFPVSAVGVSFLL